MTAKKTKKMGWNAPKELIWNPPEHAITLTQEQLKGPEMDVAYHTIAVVVFMLTLHHLKCKKLFKHYRSNPACDKLITGHIAKIVKWLKRDLTVILPFLQTQFPQVAAENAPQYRKNPECLLEDFGNHMAVYMQTPLADFDDGPHRAEISVNWLADYDIDRHRDMLSYVASEYMFSELSPTARVRLAKAEAKLEKLAKRHSTEKMQSKKVVTELDKLRKKAAKYGYELAPAKKSKRGSPGDW